MVAQEFVKEAAWGARQDDQERVLTLLQFSSRQERIRSNQLGGAPRHKSQVATWITYAISDEPLQPFWASLLSLWVVIRILDHHLSAVLRNKQYNQRMLRRMWNDSQDHHTRSPTISPWDRFTPRAHICPRRLISPPHFQEQIKVGWKRRWHIEDIFWYNM